MPGWTTPGNPRGPKGVGISEAPDDAPDTLDPCDGLSRTGTVDLELPRFPAHSRGGVTDRGRKGRNAPARVLSRPAGPSRGGMAAQPLFVRGVGDLGFVRLGDRDYLVRRAGRRPGVHPGVGSLLGEHPPGRPLPRGADLAERRAGRNLLTVRVENARCAGCGDQTGSARRP